MYNSRMDSQAIPYVALLGGNAVVAFRIGLLCWRRRATPGSIAFAVLMLGVALWSITYALELTAADLASLLIWAKVRYFGIALIPAAWLVFSIQHAGQEDWLTRNRLALLAVEPLCLLLIVWTNDLHGWYWSEFSLHRTGPLATGTSRYGWFFWIHFAYTYLLILVSISLLTRMLLQSSRPYRGQAAAVLVGALAPIIGNVMLVFRLGPVPEVDLSPFAFTLTGLAVLWGLFRFRLLDIVPVARDTIVKNMNDGLIAMDAQNRIVDLNPAARALLGCTASDAIGQTAQQVLSRWPALLTHCCGAGETHTEIIERFNAERRCFSLRVSHLRNRRGRIVGRLIVLHDITERKRIEKDLQRAREAAGAAKERIILESIADGVIVFDPAGKITVVNSTVARYIGVPAEQIVGRPIESILNDVDAQAKKRLLGLLTNDRSHAQFKWRDKTLSASIAPVQLASGETVGNVAVLRDVTREVEVERARESLLAITAHELRTPLNAIINFANMGKAGMLSSEQQSEANRRIAANGERLLVIVNNLLEQASLEVGQTKLIVSSFSPAELVETACQAMDTVAQEKGLELIPLVSDDVPDMVWGDEQRLFQILVNLIGNGIKFTAIGTVTVRVLVPDKKHWALAVSDTGVGIAEKARDRIFMPFELAEDPTTREHAGAGLGLSIVKRLVDLMGGEIKLESTVGQGSTFTVVLPIRSHSSASASRHSRTPSKAL
jgi:PAS domain S-box-containing protein